MKLLFDQNLSYRLIQKVIEEFPQSIHIAALHLDTASDFDVWKYAKENGYVIVSKDSDFNELTTYHGFPPHIIWLRTGNSSVEKNGETLLKHAVRIKAIIKANEIGIIEIIG
ncbi:MAG TPA: DUF5615 family PIN-like protein [Sulfuricurvum sp.]|nr:MAG: hypothetical protein B7Y30_02285 [Campylobacterales bacterium 16-40-21]OZA04206.1 MAG: hypothetical protein B7X89_01230 [Sulfuricurvum sp. 17-40-25]HQS66217.1 DUF5615 family PIN-like protein [Sulfuricurvum sp.]HQT35581.1 DUF5615 family PIN-like protein [Sulfuricurvum sp.]